VVFFGLSSECDDIVAKVTAEQEITRFFAPCAIIWLKWQNNMKLERCGLSA
jgi:hypothetical protein